MLKTLLISAVLVAPTMTMADTNDKGTTKKYKKYSFALIADAPYGDQNVTAFESLVNDVNQDRGVHFVMHGGDIKSGSQTCSNDRLNARFELYQQFNKPFIYTPGDNEWTDCHRTNNGSYNPLERLDYLRQLFFANPDFSTGGKKMRVIAQSRDEGFEQYVENAMFYRAGVVFSTVHVVGSNNNLRPWSGIDSNDSFNNPRADRLAEFESRENASIAWLNKIFEQATNKNAKGVFILIHADPQFAVNFDQEGRAGFNRFLETLSQLTLAFKKPVLLAHGDSHIYFVDKPKLVPWYADGSVLDSSTKQTFVPNLTRVQTFGDSPQHWLKITIEPSLDDLFLIQPQVVNANL
ncbi:metallophosphoesterase [Aliikangiella maris]|uniref:Metallophosphoesterase n=2 Tax=Aliikangiella maris TaxID=3162458 RepID=A0ABV2BYT4_9GAMM